MKHGRTVVIIGIYSALLGLVSSALVVWLRSQGLVSEWWLLLSLSFLGIGQGAVISPNQTLTALAFATLAVSDWSGAFIAGYTGITVVVAVTLVIAHVERRQRVRTLRRQDRHSTTCGSAGRRLPRVEQPFLVTDVSGVVLPVAHAPMLAAHRPHQSS